MSLSVNNFIEALKIVSGVAIFFVWVVRYDNIKKSSGLSTANMVERFSWNFNTIFFCHVAVSNSTTSYHWCVWYNTINAWGRHHPHKT